MRTGACTLQQALTAEAASVLKHSLGLATRRGHAQVTPLHVAATLLSSSSSNLLRRACLRSQPHHPPASHPLRCRALELCFNVALNRLPTTPPPSSGGPFLGSQPSLSNALIAALKRAQAHQRRGCIELQQQQLQQQQPLLAIKVELEHLIISILDDPSVSRVMREAGFSSTCVRSNLKLESSVLSHSSPFLLESHKDSINHGSSFWQSPLYRLSSQQRAPFPAQSSHKEDVSAVFEVMLRKPGKRTNTVVVGDSVSMTEGIVAELMAKVERGEVPDELKTAHFIRLHLSYVHLRLMSRTDVELKVSDLRRKISTLASDGVGGGVIIHAGDLRWAVSEETRDGFGFKPVEHMVAELGKLLSELRSSMSSGGGTVNNKVWLLATASYHTYVRCQMRRPSLETQWALQAVVVPSGGLALSLQAPSDLDSRLTKLSEHPFQLLGSKVFGTKDDDEKLVCCAECTSNFEKEASIFKSETKDISCGSSQVPCWLQRHRAENHKVSLLELKRKWNSLCQNLHHTRHSQTQLFPSLNQSSISKSNTCSSSCPWWSSSNQSNDLMPPHSLSFSETTTKLDRGFPFNIVNVKNGIGNWPERDESKLRFSEVSLHSLVKPGNQGTRITLCLGSAPVSNSATSNEQKEVMAGRRELTWKLQDNIPCQSEIIPSIVEALDDRRSCEKKGLRILIQGSDCISKRRLSRTLVEHFGGSQDRLIHIDMRKWASKTRSWEDILKEALGRDSKFVVFMENIDKADANFIRSLIDVLKEVSLAETIFIMTTSSSANFKDIDEDSNNVIKMKLQAEVPSANKDLKRKPETGLQDKPKRHRTGGSGLDLNLLAEEEEEEGAVLSGPINETDGGNPHLPSELPELITVTFTMDADPERSFLASENLLSKLRQTFDEAAREAGN